MYYIALTLVVGQYSMIWAQNAVGNIKKHFWWLFFRSQKPKLFQKFLFLVLLCFCEVFGVSRGVILATFIAQSRFLGEKVGPSFLHTIIAGLIFKVYSSPEAAKRETKTARKNDIVCGTIKLHVY